MNDLNLNIKYFVIWYTNVKI